MKLVQYLKELLRKIVGWFAKAPQYRVKRVEDIPDRPEKNVIYIVGEGEYLWFAVFKCPCGCGETIQLSLMQGNSPKWKMTEHNNNTASFHPSVWRKTGCRSHFFIKAGKVLWC